MDDKHNPTQPLENQEQPTQSLEGQNTAQNPQGNSAPVRKVNVTDLIIGICQLVSGVLVLVFLFTGNETGKRLALLLVIVSNGFYLLRWKAKKAK
ncbi:hypothetical protein KA047_02700 [Candidatus Saccharibacteria bacterium]|nr:hypothetical protein [Candidatus Saccharibacteria bacterium]